MGERLVPQGVQGDDSPRAPAVRKHPLNEPALFGFIQLMACNDCGHVCGPGGCTCWWCLCCRDECCCRHKEAQ